MGIGDWGLGFGIWDWAFTPIQAEMVFGHNLQHMAPFGMLTIAFCMVFQGATLIFSTPGARFLAPGPDSGPGPPNWGPGRNLESKLGTGPLGPRASVGPKGPFGPLGPWALWAQRAPGPFGPRGPLGPKGASRFVGPLIFSPLPRGVTVETRHEGEGGRGGVWPS